ncbi:phosphodiester glycosidase family protein [Feifania hominis]|uniref:phosphodiester glycosidase family protein n=1 Tax=Feifania hominis TaxID=2763660 RepID=UPI002015EF35|nr:phosphodiester glycosidase family protein [Feifania hominis]
MDYEKKPNSGTSALKEDIREINGNWDSVWNELHREIAELQRAQNLPEDPRPTAIYHVGSIPPRRGAQVIRLRPAQSAPARDAGPSAAVAQPVELPKPVAAAAAVSKTPAPPVCSAEVQHAAAAEAKPVRNNGPKPSALPSRSPAQAQTRPGAPVKKSSRVRRRLTKLAVAAAVLVVLYCIAVFSDIPFIKKWRTIYIETAMSTLSHHWLATAFIPRSVIEEAMAGLENTEQLQDGAASDWNGTFPSVADAKPWAKEQKKFFANYPMIDQDSFNAYVAAHPDEVLDADGYLMIDKAGIGDGGTTIRTTAGDQVLAIDTRNGIVIVQVEGEGYVGKLAIVKDPSTVSLAPSPTLGERGTILSKLAEQNDAVLGINASGFLDPNGRGNGGTPYGLVLSDGEILNQPAGGSYKVIGFDKKNRLNIGTYSDLSQFRDAVEFKPALVINGEKMVEGSAGWGLHPRSAIGQTETGEVLMLIIDGRQPGYSIGCTVEDCADIMLRYDAVQACNLDGGSSSIMYYNGRKITKPSAGDKENGRTLPNAFLVSRQ